MMNTSYKRNRSLNGSSYLRKCANSYLYTRQSVGNVLATFLTVIHCCNQHMGKCFIIRPHVQYCTLQIWTLWFWAFVECVDWATLNLVRFFYSSNVFDPEILIIEWGESESWQFFIFYQKNLRLYNCSKKWPYFTGRAFSSRRGYLWNFFFSVKLS